ncbi:SpdD protein [Streptomyces sp. Isolate_219]|uniref:SpdD protein n=1 Tax=Streptomyces sp. Isolate_219 TaxID=2950110 RepID=UPI0021CA1FEE|nr:SpdD protein [Streptomyces sp. Isolate_219]MCR8574026.1 SpdD protein [Streptomyces sp. Isolate_219]
MLFRPQLPPAPTESTHVAGSSPVTHTPASACSCQHTAGPVMAPRRSLPSVSAGAVAAVLVGGVVLTALLTAVAVSAVSVAVAAVVLRSLLANQRHR